MRRGKEKLRTILYQMMVRLLARNKEFCAIYDYYVTRVRNPLKRRQAMIADIHLNVGENIQEVLKNREG